MSEHKAVISLSGGADSATILAMALNEGREVKTFGFYYGSKHNKWELTAARKIAGHYNVPFVVMDISTILGNFKSALLLGQGEIPEGHYQAENMKQTVVPCRNLIFISILAGLADSVDFNEIWIGVHTGDRAVYPDCREETMAAMFDAIYLGTDKRVLVYTPIQSLNKVGVIKKGLELKVPYELTRTCYKDQEKPCGVCGSCRERLEAFELAGIKDPVEYSK